METLDSKKRISMNFQKTNRQKIRKIAILIQLQLLVNNWIEFCIAKLVTYLLRHALFSIPCTAFALYFSYFTGIKDFKNYGKWFLFHLKSSYNSSQDFSFFFFYPPFHSFQVQRVRWNYNNYDNVNWFALISKCNIWDNSDTTLYLHIKIAKVIDKKKEYF